MKLTTLDRPLPVPTHDCAQIATILKAAGHSHHPLGTAVAIAVLAPAIADRVVGAPAERFDLEVGTVDIPVGDDEWGRVALGPTVRRAAAIVTGCGGAAHFGEDQHGAPLLLDRDACDHAVDVVRWSDPRCRAFDWSVEEVRRSACLHIAQEFPCPALLLAMAGLQGEDACHDDVLFAQRTVATWWEARLSWTIAERDRLQRLLEKRSYGAAQLFDAQSYWRWLN